MLLLSSLRSKLKPRRTVDGMISNQHTSVAAKGYDARVGAANARRAAMVRFSAMLYVLVLGF